VVSLKTKSLSELLIVYNNLDKSPKKERGSLFERIVFEMLQHSGLKSEPSHKAVTGEQIDRSFRFADKLYPVQAEYESRQLSLDKIEKFDTTVLKWFGNPRGLVVSASGLRPGAIMRLVHQPSPRLILFTGGNLLAVLTEKVKLSRVLERKIKATEERKKPLLEVSDFENYEYEETESIRKTDKYTALLGARQKAPAS